MDSVEFEISPEEAGQRLDLVVVRRVAGMSRARVRRLAASGGIRINGRRAKKGVTVAAGDRISLLPPPPADFPAAADPQLDLVVLHEDAWLVAVDKPPGVPTHPLRPDELGTVAGALVALYPEMAGVGYSAREPGIVHRLDNGTSGVLLAARDVETFEGLRAALKAGAFDKRYVALCAGVAHAPAMIEVPLANDPGDRRRMVACPDPRDAERLGARLACTEILSATPAGDLSLVEVRARSATRHQVRVHLAQAGHPLAGDPLYGGPAVAGLERHFLHASSIALTHPVTGDRLRIEAPVPPDLTRVLGPLGLLAVDSAPGRA